MQKIPRLEPETTSACEPREVFGRNMRTLTASYSSLANLCVDLGISRTQFDHFLSGRSFPRPEILRRICDVFDVDARILLEPVIPVRSRHAIFDHPEVSDFLGTKILNIPQIVFPDGFYCFSRCSFMEPESVIFGLVYVFRQGDYTFLRGYEPKNAMLAQGFPVDARTREFRGVILPQEDGIAAWVSHRGATANSFNYLGRVATFNGQFWIGYAIRTVAESSEGCRATRQIYEFLGRDTNRVLFAAREAGYRKPELLTPFQRKILRLGRSFN